MLTAMPNVQAVRAVSGVSDLCATLQRLPDISFPLRLAEVTLFRTRLSHDELAVLLKSLARQITNVKLEKRKLVMKQVVLGGAEPIDSFMIVNCSPDGSPPSPRLPTRGRMLRVM